MPGSAAVSLSCNCHLGPLNHVNRWKYWQRPGLSLTLKGASLALFLGIKEGFQQGHGAIVDIVVTVEGSQDAGVLIASLSQSHGPMVRKRDESSIEAWNPSSDFGTRGRVCRRVPLECAIMCTLRALRSSGLVRAHSFD